MRIAHLARVSHPYHPYGGLEQHVYRLTLELARLGHQIELYTQPPTLGWEQSVREPVWPEGVTHHFVPYRSLPLLRRNSVPDRLTNYPLFALRLGRAVRQLTPTPRLVHAHGLAAWGYSRKLLPGVPLVLNPHGMEEFKVNTLGKKLAYAPFRELLRQTARSAVAIIATDRVLIPEVIRFLRVPAQRVKFVPNAIALDEILQIAKAVVIREIRQLYKPVDENLLFLSVGRLETNKGFDKMLMALAQTRETLPTVWRWVVVGTGSELAALERLTQKLNLTAHVIFAGQLADPPLHALYAVADVLVHPTLYEGSSLVTLEAMAHALPIIASNVGGLPDKVQTTGPYRNGWLLPPGDVTALAQALQDCAALTSAQRCELGQNSQQLVQKKFTWQVAARQTVELYESLL